MIASIGMIFVYRAAAGKHPVPLRDVPIILLTGVIGFGVYNVALNYGVVTINPGAASFIVGQIPVAITLLAVVFLGERLSKVAFLGMLVSFAGVILIALSHHHPTGGLDIGIIYLLVGVISAGIYHVVYKHLLHRYNAIELTAYGIWGGTLSMLFYTPTLWAEIPHATATATWAVVYLGVFPGLIGYVSWSYVLRYVPASKAASAFYVMPVITVFLSWLCLGQMPAQLALVGGLIALCGAIIVARGGKAATKKPPSKNAEPVLKTAQ
jgi:drug/metabolite transporter (DMT)-like permease